MAESEGFVYLIRSQCKPVVKIGKAKHPIKRIKEIQTGNADPLYLHSAIYCDNNTFLENQLHSLLKHDWLKGEWFRYHIETEKKLSEYCQQNSLTVTRCDFSWHEGMMCHLKGLQIFAPNYLRVFLRDGDCCSMSGCIKLAKQILPQVEIIQTFSGNRLDTRYLLHKGEWIANMMKEQTNV